MKEEVRTSLDDSPPAADDDAVTLRCHGCGRAHSTCWALPCFELEILLAKDETAHARGEDVHPELRAWVEAGGAVIRRRVPRA